MKKSTEVTPLNIGHQILLKNNQFLIFNKPAGVAVQPDKTDSKSILDLAEIYTKKKLFVTHRIDRPVSGVLVIAKNSKCAGLINTQFQKKEIQKIYLAIVKNAPEKKCATLTHHLIKNEKTNKSFVAESATPKSKEAILKYEVLNQSDNYTLLKIELITGRHHQIRAQLAAINCPIKGDVKYGARRGNKDRSIHLHAWQISLKHPITKEAIQVTAPPPEDSLWDYFASSL